MKPSFDQSMKAFRNTLQQAQDSLKILETLEKEVLERAKAFSRLPRRLPRAADEKIVASLKSLGMATQDDLTTLEERMTLLTERLTAAESQLTAIAQAKAAKTARTAKAMSTEAQTQTQTQNQEPEPEATA